MGPALIALCCFPIWARKVLRIDRPGGNAWPNPIVDRGRHTIELDIRSEATRSIVFEATDRADVVVEGYRPGVMERLRFGPDELLERNPRLIYARITGWGQSGPLAGTAGHDINYIALTGALKAIAGADGHPIPPLNLIGDFGGGSLYSAFGILAALWERERSGKGQVIDAAIVDGVASIMTTLAGFYRQAAFHSNWTRPTRWYAPFYRCYECADGTIHLGRIARAAFLLRVARTGGCMSGFASTTKR